MQTSLGHGNIVEGVGKSGLADRIKEIVKDAKGHVKLESRGFVFNGTVSKLTPLFDRIQETDELIDRIVYGLYGLTEEEIKVVEGE